MKKTILESIFVYDLFIFLPGLLEFDY